MRRILIKPVVSVSPIVPGRIEHESGGRWYRQLEETGECFLGCFKDADEAIEYTRRKGDEPVVDAFHVDPLTLKNVPSGMVR